MTHFCCLANTLWVGLVLLMAEISNNHLGCMKPYKQWENYLSTGAGFQPSTVSPGDDGFLCDVFKTVVW